MRHDCIYKVALLIQFQGLFVTPGTFRMYPHKIPIVRSLDVRYTLTPFITNITYCLKYVMSQMITEIVPLKTSAMTLQCTRAHKIN